jgi:hypothetical protein
MSYNKSPFKMAPKSPLTKALKGNQGKLPQHLQEAIKAAPGSPAKLTTDAAPTAKLRYNEADTSYEDAPGFIGPPSPPERKSKPKPTPKYDKELNTLVAARKGLKKGTSEYNTIQNQINAKLGSKKVHGRGTSTKTSMSTATATKTAKVAAPKVEAPKVNTALPAKPSAPAASGKTEKPVKKNSPRITQTANRATVVTKSNGVKKKETVNKNTGNKKVVVKDANTRTVTKTNKAGESTTKTTKRVGKGRIKGAIKDARLARLDKKATRQATKATDKKSKGAGKLSGLGK